ncbi:MAG: extracellular solute-binding protein [Bacteroidota bacterium]|nr:extracellular solute-binding protein [Bacteroidota bacterium]
MKIKKLFCNTLLIIIYATLLISCGKSSKKTKSLNTNPVSIKQFDTPPGADPSVNAEMGGKGFTGEGWQTSVNYNLSGDPKAVKGGNLVMSTNNFPATLRIIGKDANTTLNFMIENMVYERLLNLDPVTQDYIPGLATHWKISDDKMKFTFRINPEARWADGKPVTSEDIIATWKLFIDPGILEAYNNILYQSYEMPVAESKYIVSVKSKEMNWRQFLYFASSMTIFPAHFIGSIDGKTYLEKFQFEIIPGSGPYLVDKNDIKKGQSIALRRRSDYWAEKEKFNMGLNNFDLVRFDIVEDQSLEFEKFKKGEIDVILISRAQWWAERFDFDEFNRGVILKRKVFNENPNGTQGITFNMRKPPFDDIKIRLAFSYLFDREKYNEKLFYSSYIPIDSYFPGSVNENPNNPKIRFNLDKAQQLLSEAGWTQKNSDGYLVKDGKVFELELPFGDAGQEKYLTVYQEDLKKVGVKINLKQIDRTTSFKMGNERSFNLLTFAWTGLRVPNPESSMKSNTADEPNTTNWSGIKDKRIDELCEKYNVTFDKNERIKIIREIDNIAMNLQPNALGWYLPAQRIAFQNKFGFPEWILPRVNNYLTIPTLWYTDQEKLAAYEEAKTDKSKTLPQGVIDQKFWLDVKGKEELGETVSITETNYDK